MKKQKTELNFTNKKIGIWGLGIVGTSARNFMQQYTNSIQILDQKEHNDPICIKQTPQTTLNFLQNNDYIIASPGIPLHNYAPFHNKIITEVDILQQLFIGTKIAITGTLGKTTITHLIAESIKQHHPATQATGNIGYPILMMLQQSATPSHAIIELSSFQLQHAQHFAPDLAIITNFYENHLDHHKTVQEYFHAKCNMLAHQTQKQQALLPYHLFDQIKQQATINAQIFLFNTTRPATINHPTFYIKDDQIVLHNTATEKIIFTNLNNLPPITYQENLLIIIATLYLQNIPLSSLIEAVTNIALPEHRMQNLGTFNGITFYNDSKSTVWQATQQALQSLPPGKSCSLLLGGLSKGTDRTPLIKYLQHKNINVYAFGCEAKRIKNLCDQYKIFCKSFNNLDNAFNACLLKKTDIVLLSPAGSSFDLFKNYQDRGKAFSLLVKNK